MAGNNSIFGGTVSQASGRQNSIGGTTVRTDNTEGEGIQSGASFPANPSDGDLFNIIGSTDANITDGLYRYDGTDWVEIGSGAGLTPAQTQEIAANTAKIGLTTTSLLGSANITVTPNADETVFTLSSTGGGTTTNFFGSIIETFRATNAGFRYYCFLTVDSTSGENVTWEIVLNRVDRNQSPRVLQGSTGDGTNPLTGTGTIAQAQTAFGFYNTTAQLILLTWQ